ncbi:class I SAM-dependent methyltransferase [Leptolyngbya sp. 7M]|uniref:class I SAM-dependent methyltransferase n=1 Tax=Leptolyngbya sp. 7M TaxID=2812896 RepID=UPI001B8B4718|nr:methyltransferase domain-containing protein [Leptolyngbya sp. 7M]QYO67396.1 class I SAM-dependent methyltransferase [Leptolyngbya sp. 7M]
MTSHIKTLWQQDFCDVVRCDYCGFCYSYPYIAGDARFYTLAYEREGYPKWKWEHQLTSDALSQSKNFTLLEIGAGDGTFLKGISPSLTAKEHVLCTEYSDYGKREIEKYGIQCLAQDVRTIETEQFHGYFNVICMFQVIEHMDQLDLLFQRLNWLSRPNASLFISVPNPKLIEFAELNGGLLDMPPNHIGRWNKDCFEKIGKCWRWEIEGYEIENNSLPSKAMLFCKYRFWRESQHYNTFANRVLQIKNGHLKKGMQAVGLGLYALASLPQLVPLQSPELGFSQWVHLRKMD